MENSEKFVSEIKNLVNLYLNRSKKKDSANFYFGRVVDNKDPDKLGRIKVKVFNVFDELETEDLPYCLPDFSPSGEMVIPTVGSLVKVYFENDDYNLPHYTTKIVDKTNVNSDVLEDYPNTVIFFNTDTGDIMKINKKKNEYTLRLGSGFIMTVDSKGNVEIDTEATETGNLNLNVRGTIYLNGGTIQLPNVTVDPSDISVTPGFLATGIDSFTGRPIGTRKLRGI